MRLQDVMKYQPGRDINSSRSRSRHRSRLDSNRNRKGVRTQDENRKTKKGSLIRPGNSIQMASRHRHRRCNLPKTIELDNERDEDSENSSVEILYQNNLKRNIDSNGDDESSCKESDDEDEIPYKMNFSQPDKKTRANGDSSDSDDDGGYESPSDMEEEMESGHNHHHHTTNNPQTKKKKLPAEPLRPGDVIEYDNTMIFAAGSGRAHTTATVLGTCCLPNNATKFPLTLSTGDYLDPSVRIRRTHECIKGATYAHAGLWKPISSFRLRRRLLRNPDGTPVEAEGGVHGTSKAFRKLRENLHQTAVEFIRGDHDDAIRGIRSSSSSKSKSKTKGSAKTPETGNRAKPNSTPNTNTNNSDEEDESSSKSCSCSSSSSSSDGSLLRLEFERLTEERKKKLQLTEKKKQSTSKLLLQPSFVRKAPPYSLSDVSDTDGDSDSDSDSGDNDVDKRQKHALHIARSSTTPGLSLKKISRTTRGTANSNMHGTHEKVRQVKASDRRTNNTNSKFHPHGNSRSESNTKSESKTKRIDISIDIESKPNRPNNKSKGSDNLSLSSSSSSSCSYSLTLKTKTNTTSTSLASKKQRPRPSVAMTTVASKVDAAKRSEEFLDSDLDSSSDEDDSLLLGNPIFTSIDKSSSSSSSPRTKRKDKIKTKTKIPFTKEQSVPKRTFDSPIMEKNALDLFEDSSGDDDSSGGSACRRRNRRGERLLRSPSIDVLHRKHQKQKQKQNHQPTKRRVGGRDNCDWLTQEHDTSEERETSRSTKISPRKTIKRSVVVGGYQPLSLLVDTGQEEEEDSSPPSLAKAYRNLKAKQQRKRKEQYQTKNAARTESVSNRYYDGGDRQKKQTKRGKSSREKRYANADAKESLGYQGESNRRKLQREKQKLQTGRSRPPPYPTERSDPHLAEMSTQENEWSDFEQGEESSDRQRHIRFNHSKKRKTHKRERSKPTPTIAIAKSKSKSKSADSSSLESEPSPQKRSRTTLSHKQNPTSSSRNHIKSSLSSLDDSEKEEEKHTRKRLTPKSKLHNRNRIGTFEFQSKPSKGRSRNKGKHQRYELSPSPLSSPEVDHRRHPRTPWSTDCEVDSPLPYTHAKSIVYGAAHRDTIEKGGSAKSLRKNKPRKNHPNVQRTPSVFEFASQDENEDPDGRFAKTRFSPKLMSLSKQRSSKPKSYRKASAR